MLPCPPFPVLCTIISSVPYGHVSISDGPQEQNFHTSSSKSKKDSPLASLIVFNDSAPFFATSHPRLPVPLAEHPATSFAHGTENTRPGVRSFPDPVMAIMSGNPSRLTSPSLRGRGIGGLKVVSSTRRDDEG